MVHKKYTYKDGKRYGPYAYETRRVDGKVVTSYLGSSHTSSRQLLVYGFLIVLIVALIFISFAYRDSSSTGRVTLDVRTVYNEGDLLDGDLTFRIKEGELVPRDSSIVISYGDQSKTLLLSDVIAESTTTGSFYAEGTALSGEGEGYGLVGTQTHEATIDFTLSVSGSESSESAPSDSEEAPVITPDVVEATPSAVVSEEPDVTAPDSGSGSSGGSSSSSTSSSSVSSEPSSDSSSSPSPPSSPPSESASMSAGITGEVVSENSFEVAGQVSSTGEFRYALEPGQDVRLVPGSVRVGEESIPDSSLSIDEQNGDVVVTTSYYTSEEGFGSAFLGDYALALQVDMEQLDLRAVPGQLDIQLVYQDVVIASRRENVDVTSAAVELNDTNETLSPASSIVQLKAIPLLRIAPGESVTIDMAEYFEGASSFSAEIEDFTVAVDGTLITFTPIETYKGSRKATIVAQDAFGEVMSNEFTLLVSSGAVRITTSRDKIVVGEPVRWEKKIVVEDAESLQVELPESVEDVVVKKREGEQYVDVQQTTGTDSTTPDTVSTSPITGQVTIEVNLQRQFFLKRWWNDLVGTITGNVVEETPVATGVDVTLPAEPAEYLVEYYTPAPEAFEEETSTGKRVTISAPDELAYTDVIASTTLGNENHLSSPESILLYWNAPVEEHETSLKDVVEVAETEVVDDVTLETSSASTAVAETTPEVVEATPPVTPDVVPESVVTANAIDGSLPETVPSETTTPASETSSASTTVDASLSTDVVEATPADVPVALSGLYTRVAVPFDAYDLDEDGFYDYIEWVVPHLSNQTYDIVLITDAQHLDENRTVVSDITTSVKYLDGNWSETIPATHYVRVTYEVNLTNGRDITVYPRTIEGTPRIDVYERNGTDVIASFGSLSDNTYNRLILTQLTDSQDSFDLHVLDGSVQFDQILDPADTTPPTISYVAPTPANNTYQTGTSFFANVSSADENGEHYAFTDIDRSLVLWLRMDESSGNTLTDLSSWSNTVTKGSGVTLTANGLYNQSAVFRGFPSDNISVTSSSTLNLKRGMTFAFWINYTAGSNQFARFLNRREISTTPQTYYGFNINDLGGTTRITMVTNLSGTSNVKITGPRISQDRWNHVVFVYNDSGDIEAYINGTAVSVSNVVASIEGSTALVIGTRGSGGTNSLNGSMDEIMIFNRSLSAQEAIALYNASLNKYYRNFTTLTNGTHTLTAHAVDLGANRNSDQRTFTIDTVVPVVTLQAPANGTEVTGAAVSFNATFSDDLSLANGTFYLWNASGSVINTSTRGLSGTEGSINLSVTLPVGGTYVWNYFVADNASNQASNATNYTLTYSSVATPLGVTITSPANRTYTFNEIPLLFNVTLDSNGDTVLYTLTNGVTNYTMSSTDLRNYNATNTSIASGSYTFKVYANDTLSTRNDTVSVTFSVNTLLVSGCANLTVANSTYTLNQSFSATGNCLGVQANNITLNGAGFTITGDGAAGRQGINATAQQLFTVENLSLVNFNTSVSIDSRQTAFVAGNVTLRNVQLASVSARGFSNISASGSGGAGGTVFLIDSNVTGFISVRGGNGTTSVPGQSGSIDIRSSFINLSRVSLDISQGTNTGGSIFTSWVSRLTLNYSSGFEALATTYGSSDLKQFSLENRTGGRLVWADPLFEGESGMSLVMPVNVSAHIVLRSNFASLNTTAASALNIPTVITFYGMSGAYNAPVMLRDHAYCSSATCTNSTSLNAQTVTFTVQDWSSNYTIGEDPTTPGVSIIYPTNTTYSSSVTALNYTVSDTAGNIQACWYSLNNGATNTTITCGTNATGLTASQGSNTWRVYTNDSAGNSNSTSMTFSLDGAAPTIDLGTQTESNATYLSRPWVIVNITATDSNLQAILVRLNNATALVNSSSSATSPLFANFTNLIDGVYYFNATANDTLGNTNSTVTRTITIDTTRPSLSFVSPTETNNSYFSRSAINVNITGSDSNLQALTIRLYSGGSLISSVNSTTSPFFTSFEVDPGVYQFNVSVNDSAGNVNNSETRTVTVDTSIPLISFDSPTLASGTYGSTSIAVNLTAADDNLETLRISLSNSTQADINTTSNRTSPLYINFTGLASGTYYVNATVNDTAGTNVTLTRTYVLDTTTPSVSIVYPTNTSYSSLITALNYTVIDAFGTVQACWYSLNGGVSNTTVTCGTNVTGLTSSQGSNTWTVYVNDTAGNRNSTSMTFSLDGAAPTIDFGAQTESNNTYLNRTWAIINVTAADSNLQTIVLRLNNATALVNSSTSTTSPLFANFTNLLDGVHYFNATANDTLGNGNTTATRTITVDTTVPTASFVSPTLSAGTYSGSSLSFNVTASDTNLGTITVYLYNATALVNSSSSATSPLFANFTNLLDGAYTVNVTINDSAGNTFTLNRSYTIDSTVPSLSFVSPTEVNNTYFARSSIKVNVTASDSNLQTIVVRFYSGGSLISSVNSTSSPFYTSLDSLDDGTYQFNATVNDTAGNINHSETRTVTVDIAVPFISLASPTLASGNYSGTALAVNLTAVDTHLETLRISLSNSTQADINITSNRTSPLYINFTGLAADTYYVNATVNDTAGTNVTLTRTYLLDSAVPLVSIVYPTNTTYSASITALNYTVSDRVGTVQACWYSLNNGVTNTTIACGTNVTSLTSSQGSNTWTVYVNDTVGNRNSTSMTFSIDGVAPTIDFGTQTEANNTYLNRTWAIINVTAADSNLQTISIRLNNATALVNSSSSATSPLFANFTNLLDGIHYFNATANDTLGNGNTTATRTITIDTTRPLLQFVSPTLAAGTYTASSIALNATATDTNLGTITVYLYNATALVNSSTSTTSPLYANFTNLIDGTYYANATVNDTAGNTNVTLTTTYVLDSRAPSVSIVYPTNTTYSSLITALNYTVSDSAGNTQACWYSLNNGATNTTITCGTNATGLTASQRSNTWRVYTNDSAGNSNSTSMTFTVDTLVPTIEFVTPTETNNSYLARSFILINTTASDSNLQSIVARLNNATALVNSSTSATSPLFANFTNLLDGMYYFNTTVNDSAGNSNSTSTYTVTLDTIAPVVSFTTASDSNATLVARRTVILNASAIDTNLVNITLFVMNASGFVVNTSSSNNATTPFYRNFTVISDGTYYFNFSATDRAGNTNVSETRVITIDSIRPLIAYSSGTENAAEKVANTSLAFNLSLTESNVVNMTFSLYNSSSLYNRSVVTVSTSTFNWTNIPAGDYRYEANVTDIANNRNGTGSRTVTLIRSCLDICTEENGCVLANTSCYLSSDLCTGGVCNFTNFTLRNTSVYTLYNATGDAYSLALTLSSNASDAFGSLVSSRVLFGGKNGSTLTGGSRGGHAGTLNITLIGLFNRTNALFTGIGGRSTSGDVGGNGGILQISYHGLLGEDTTWTNTTLGGLNATNNITGSAGTTLMVKDLNCPRDADVVDSGIIDTIDLIALRNVYRNVSTDSTFNQRIDINCDGVINVVDLARMGFEMDRGTQ